MKTNDLRVLNQKQQDERHVALKQIFLDAIKQQRPDLTPSNVTINESDDDVVSFKITSEKDFTDALTSFGISFREALDIPKTLMRVETSTQEIFLHHNSAAMTSKLNVHALMSTMSKNAKSQGSQNIRIYNS